MAIGIAMSGAFFGGIAAYIYLKIISNRNKEQLGFVKHPQKDKISSKAILKKIIAYAVPFVILSIVLHIYNFTDQLLILRTLEKMNYSASDVEFIASSISTWATKICAIITAIATGITTSLIPTIVSAYTQKRKKDVNRNINKALALSFTASLPLVLRN